MREKIKINYNAPLARPTKTDFEFILVRKKGRKMKLVLVESPAKCAKIAEYLGAEFECIATMGHFRVLPDLAHICTEDGTFTPTFEDKKGAPIAKLASAIRRASHVYLATDDDREGEAIAFHLCDRFGLSLADTPRILFHEITREALQHAVANPIRVRLPIVWAQQARQILDILIGFQLTPYLWQRLTQFSRDGLSAGRCQSPTLRLVAENCSARESATPPEKTDKEFDLFGIFTFQKLRFHTSGTYTSTEIEHLFTQSPNVIHRWMAPTESKIRICSPPEAFTTCLFQQTMSNELHLSPKESMACAQELYEAGLITYMRTDGTSYSTEFWQQIRQFVHPELLTPSAPAPSTAPSPPPEGESAHEAIRVVQLSVRKTDKVSTKSQRVYEKIWHRSVESCMIPATFRQLILRIQGAEEVVYEYLAEIRENVGWLFYTPLTDKDREREQAYHTWGAHSEEIKYELLEALEHLPKGKLPYYTEAKVVSLLKEKGIGRPSTYANLLDKNLQRKYMEKKNIPGQTVSRTEYCMLYNETFSPLKHCHLTQQKVGEEQNKLVITTLGKMVLSCLYPTFEILLGYDYTQQMETQLDSVAQNQLKFAVVCQQVFQQLTQLLTPTGVASTRLEKKTYPVEGGKFVFMIGKYGPMLRHANDKSTHKSKATFTAVKATAIDMDKLKRGEYTFAELTTEPPSPSPSPSEPLTHPAKEEEERVLTPFLKIRKGKYGFYLFYQTPSMNQPQFYKLSSYKLPRGQSYLTCDLPKLLGWIHTTHGIPVG